MLNIVKEQKNGILSIRLSGAVDELANLDQLIGPPAPEMHVYCREVKRINSVGVKNWIRYFTSAKNRGSKLRFLECSIPVVEQINLISNFLAGGEIESLYVPYSCGKCKSELIGLFKVADLRNIGFKVPNLTCSKCGDKAVFDDIPEEYFAFSTRTG